MESITGRVERDGTLLHESVLVEAYLNALQDRYKACMNPYPWTLQEATERATTHELLQGRMHNPMVIKAIPWPTVNVVREEVTEGDCNSPILRETPPPQPIPTTINVVMSGGSGMAT